MFAGVIYLRQMYVRTSREVLRIEGTLRSPVNTTITEAATGRMTINAYKIEDFMIDKFNNAQNRNGSAWVLIKQLISWLQFRLDCIATGFYGCAAIMLIYLSMSEKFIDLFNLTPALVGLTLSKTFLLLGEFQYFIKVSCRVENLLTSLERLLEYSQLPDEIDKNDEKVKFNRDRAKENLRRILNARSQSFTPFKSGAITLDDFSYAYANDVAVLKHLNLSFKSGEKIGIIGRTGAGKSSMISALFRIREPQTGKIELDGKTDLSLFETRKNLSIIPQEPIIFSDTVRGNLDPFSGYEENLVWDALESVGLKQKFKDSGKGLDFELDESGTNLSVGEKQLLCLARAILKKSKILLIDEATANVDLQTDAFIQEQIKSLFKDATVLTVAHR